MRGSGSSKGRIALLARVVTGKFLRSAAVESADTSLSRVFPRIPLRFFPHIIQMHARTRDMYVIQPGSVGMSITRRLSCESVFRETIPQISCMISCGKGVFARIIKEFQTL